MKSEKEVREQLKNYKWAQKNARESLAKAIEEKHGKKAEEAYTLELVCIHSNIEMLEWMLS